MKGLKDLGLQELDRLRKRTGRQFGLERISEEDYIFLRSKYDEIESRIEEMEEVESDEA